MIRLVLALALAAHALPAAAQDAARAPVAPRIPDVIYVPTPEAVVNAMLKLANAGPNDVVYDLGCGDGRIPIAAVRDFHVKRAVGVDIDPQRIREARTNVQQNEVGDRVKIVEGDLFTMDFRDATIVTLYLLPSLNLKLRPRLLAELKPGTRIVSHAFDMGDWEPEKTETVDGKQIFLWTVPARAAGRAKGAPAHALPKPGPSVDGK